MNSLGDLTCAQFIVRKMLPRERALSIVTVMWVSWFVVSEEFKGPVIY